jgi:hypothetical protein
MSTNTTDTTPDVDHSKTSAFAATVSIDTSRIESGVFTPLASTVNGDHTTSSVVIHADSSEFHQVDIRQPNNTTVLATTTSFGQDIVIDENDHPTNIVDDSVTEQVLFAAATAVERNGIDTTIPRDDDDEDDDAAAPPPPPIQHHRPVASVSRSSPQQQQHQQRHNWTPSRQSTVSSMAGNSIEYDDDDDDDDDGRSNGMEYDNTPHHSVVLDTSSTEMSGIIAMNSFHNKYNDADERSVRSELTRPDPPSSIINGVSRDSVLLVTSLEDTGDDYLNDDAIRTDHGHTYSDVGFVNVREESDPQPLSAQEPDAVGMPLVRNVTTTTAEEAAAVEALATLSTKIAERTFFDDTIQNRILSEEAWSKGNDQLHDLSERHQYEQSWDLDRNALLAETPEAVTIRKSVIALQLREKQELVLEENDDDRTLSTQLSYRPPALQTTKRKTTGADDLVLLPRVDEHRFIASSTSSTMVGSNTVPQQPLPMNNVMNNSKSIPMQNAVVEPGYGYNVHRSDLHGTVPARTNGRRKIKLRLQEEVRNSNSSIRKHFRSSSLLGTIRKSSTRMLRFGGSIRSSFDTDDLDTSMPTELYKKVDRGSVSICWFDGTSSLELQQHVRKSVLRKIQLINESVVDLDDLRIFDENSNPPEGECVWT